MRTGPLVRRGANASRAVQGGASLFQRSSIPKASCGKQQLSPHGFSVPDPAPLIESSCLHLECRLPINLRRFLADQMGSAVNVDNDTILNVAANADELTLSKLARAIRRYSTERAHEAWVECAVTLARFEEEARGNLRPEAALCLRCARVDLGADGARAHRGAGCLMVNLTPAFESGAEPSEPHQYPAGITAERLQRVIEEFRALRAAFGLPHYELDCYITNSQVTLTWRPLPR
ncbi:MAG: hypothetical protein ACREQN_10285 [Candidatus Binataceae bacterium]